MHAGAVYEVMTITTILPKPRRAARAESLGRTPRISRLMALAIRCEGLIRDGVVCHYAELASLAHVSRARITQLMNLLNLAPDLQECLLFLPPTLSGRDPLNEHQLRGIATSIDWPRQRLEFTALIRRQRLAETLDFRGHRSHQ
jgi:hypothetical protein